MLSLKLQKNPDSYASAKNSRFSSKSSNSIPLHRRWADAYNALDPHSQAQVNYALNQAVQEFKIRNPAVTKWADLDLAESITVTLSSVYIDTTLQRELDIDWVISLLANFESVKVVPIQVYMDENGVINAWDGQHTAILLYIICVMIMKLDPSKVKIPVNRYKATSKKQMRSCFISHNSSIGKKALDPIDTFEQMVYGVRVDGSKEPAWVVAEQKQQYIEQFDLFATHDKFNDTHIPGAISRLNEINKLPPESVKWLTMYLALVCDGRRPAGEKEMVMMGQYFDRCRLERISIDTDYVKELALVADRLWGTDFGPNGKFWNKAKTAYFNWHEAMQFNTIGGPRFNKEPVHGMPFLIAQLKKSFKRPVPSWNGNSPFVPLKEDLF